MITAWFSLAPCLAVLPAMSVFLPDKFFPHGHRKAASKSWATGSKVPMRRIQLPSTPGASPGSCSDWTPLGHMLTTEPINMAENCNIGVGGAQGHMILLRDGCRLCSSLVEEMGKLAWLLECVAWMAAWGPCSQKGPALSLIFCCHHLTNS